MLTISHFWKAYKFYLESYALFNYLFLIFILAFYYVLLFSFCLLFIYFCFYCFRCQTTFVLSLRSPFASFLTRLRLEKTLSPLGKSKFTKLSLGTMRVFQNISKHPNFSNNQNNLNKFSAIFGARKKNTARTNLALFSRTKFYQDEKC